MPRNLSEKCIINPGKSCRSDCRAQKGAPLMDHLRESRDVIEQAGMSGERAGQGNRDSREFLRNWALRRCIYSGNTPLAPGELPDDLPI